MSTSWDSGIWGSELKSGRGELSRAFAIFFARGFPGVIRERYFDIFLVLLVSNKKIENHRCLHTKFFSTFGKKIVLTISEIPVLCLIVKFRSSRLRIRAPPPVSAVFGNLRGEKRT